MPLTPLSKGKENRKTSKRNNHIKCDKIRLFSMFFGRMRRGGEFEQVLLSAKGGAPMAQPFRIMIFNPAAD